MNCDNAKSQVNTQSGRRHKRNLRPAHCDDVICQQANSTVELKRPHRHNTQAEPESLELWFMKTVIVRNAS